MLRVWRFNDSASTAEVLSCGVLSLPKSAGHHLLQAQTWAPTGDWKYAALEAYLGSNPRLNNVEKALAEEDRSRLFSQGAGRVQLEASVLLRNFDQYNISR